MLAGPRSERPPIVILGTMSLHLSRDDGAPFFAGLPPANDAAQRQEYKAIHEAHTEVLLGPLDRHLEDCLLGMGVDPPKMTTLDTTVLLPDAYLQLTVPSFEYPRENLSASVRFVGTPPIAANQAPLPPWAHEVDGSRKVVLVTQGTLSNHDFGELVTPALAALAAEPDLLVVVTAGGRASASIPGPIPDNARVADYLPLDWLFPRLDVLVTNGGYARRFARSWTNPVTVSAPKRSLPSSRPTTRHQRSSLCSPISPVPLLRRPDGPLRVVGAMPAVDGRIYWGSSCRGTLTTGTAVCRKIFDAAEPRNT
jgi:hypothetical protein